MRGTTRRFRSAALIAMLVGVMTAALAGTASAAPQTGISAATSQSSRFAQLTPKDLQGCNNSPCCPNPIFIQSMENGLYVAAELNYTGGDYGMLRARASVVGNWEKFYIFLDPNVLGTCDIQNADNKLYVSEEQEYSGGDQYMLRARASHPSYYERFKIYANIGCG